MVNNRHPLVVEFYTGDEKPQNKHPLRVKIAGGAEGLVTLGQVKEITGELESLETEDKTSLVGAINELVSIVNGLVANQVKLRITNVEPQEGDVLEDNTILGYREGA